MTIEQYTEEIKPRSTNTEPSLFKLHLTAIGDIQEIHFLKQRLEKVSRVELPVSDAKSDHKCAGCDTIIYHQSYCDNCRRLWES